MKYVITGSLGHISRPIATALVAAGHEVTVISSRQENAAEIQALGANPAIGSLTDAAFVQAAFKDAGMAYLMIPPNFAVPDFPAYQRTVTNNYMSALRQSKVQHIVLLSSMGAHLREGAGPIDALGHLEEQLKSLTDRQVTILRPAFFYYNLLGMAGMLKAGGIIGSNFGDDKEQVSMVHHLDIADRAIHHLLHPGTEHNNIEYVVSDERYVAEIASVLGRAAGKEEVPWICFSDEQAYEAMLQQGLNVSLAREYVEMGKGFREGRVQEDYRKRRLPLTGTRKLESFAGDFARAYNAVP